MASKSRDLGECSIDDCHKPMKYKNLGWCGMHYQRWLRYGDALAVGQRTSHFISEVDVETMTGLCSVCGVVSVHRNRDKFGCSRKAYFTHIETAYGVTKEEFDLALKRQNNACAYDGRPFEATGAYRGPFVDHDHKTGKFRGLLCYRHNTALAAFEDDAQGVEKLLAYLNGEVT